jgi:hypothetical protein
MERPNRGFHGDRRTIRLSENRGPAVRRTAVLSLILDTPFGLLYALSSPIYWFRALPRLPRLIHRFGGLRTRRRSRRGVHRYADVPPFWEELIAHYVLMTWVHDRFTAVPYLRFLGEPASGKTRCLQVTSHLCYKSIIAGGATTASRCSGFWKSTAAPL